MAMSSNSDSLDPDEYKLLGDNAFQSGNPEKAVLHYTKAIAILAGSTGDCTSINKALLYSNRSAAHLKAGNPYGALEDANSCIQVDPFFAKGYSRKGSALHSLEQYPESISAYKEGLDLFPDNEALKNGLDSVLLESEMGVEEKIVEDDDRKKGGPDCVSLESKKRKDGEARNGEQKEPLKATAGLLGFGKNAFKGLRSSVVSAGNVVKSGVNTAGNSVKSGISTGISKASAQFKSLGTITIDLELKVYSQGEKIKGKVILNLNEPLQADHLSVTLDVKRKLNMSDDDDMFLGAPEDKIFSEAYEISGKKVYSSKEEIPFELIIPNLISKSKGKTGAVFQAIGDLLNDRDVSVPPMWSCYATLTRPGGRLLPMHSSEYRLHVND